jgi:hypothetical protein
VVLRETLIIDVHHHNLDFVPAPLPQLLELLRAGLDGLSADGALGHSHGGRHVGQHFLILAGGNAAQQRAQHMLAESAIFTQGFVSRHLHLAFGFVAQARPLQFDLAVGELHAPRLGPMMPDLAFGLAGSARSGHLLGTQHQDRLQGLHLNLVQHGLHHLAGAFDQVDDRKQDLSVALAELLDDCGRLLGSPRHDMVRFLHGGWLLFRILFGNRLLSKPAPPPPINLQLSPGHDRMPGIMQFRRQMTIRVLSSVSMHLAGRTGVLYDALSQTVDKRSQHFGGRTRHFLSNFERSGWGR